MENQKALLLWADPCCNSGSPTRMHFFTPQRVECPGKERREKEAPKLQREGAEEEWGLEGRGSVITPSAVTWLWCCLECKALTPLLGTKDFCLFKKEKKRKVEEKLMKHHEVIDTLYQSEHFKHGKTRDWKVLQPQCQVYFWIMYIYLYLKRACLNLYWVHIGPETTGLCSSLSPCWRHETLYQTQSQRHYWDVDWLIALYLHHFWCFYSCTTHPLFFWFWFNFNLLDFVWVYEYIWQECENE